ncbi:hypothetical protein [Haloferula sargassicola]|uniref:hypothetical protein n=1 Tax=Haloferula sargassicola TaxID=490096 RepID=UPI00336536D3
MSWIPDPRLGRIGWLGQVGEWSDRHDQLRTGIPVLLLATLVGLWLTVTGKHLAWWLAAFFVLTDLVVVVELGQLFIPGRNCDPADMLWGGLGAASGLIAVGVGSWVHRWAGCPLSVVRRSWSGRRKGPGS